MPATRHFLLAAGGTGGHMLPAYALAGELIARGHRVALVSDDRGLKIPGAPGELETHVLPAGRVSGGPVGWLKAALAIRKGRRMAIDLIGEFDPAVVVGFGGYPSLPSLLAAGATKRPRVIHEQNAVLGRVNRLIASKVDAIASSFATTRHAERATLTGNPVRDNVIALRDSTYWVPEKNGELHLLVTGGSQGASIFGRVVPDAIARLPQEARARLKIVQQTRKDDVDAVAAAYTKAGISAEVAPFFADLPQRIANAHLVIARSGASTVAELACIGRPALLVPYMHATDDHQTENARALADAGGAWLLPEPHFTAEALEKHLASLLADPAALPPMAQAAWKFGKPDAAERLADLVAKLATGGSA
ncbi:MAG: undecaprenyldiphospho-muramoylpentapeptide beta-N-acetylglucosaminyltransferase [Alphaproteobacteria bacterium]|nr:undecaprenyldiphospho-muramoylpentapeptide beta-N-acetylglucosaminyltransferase [Alphaproteobacteria bacterium]